MVAFYILTQGKHPFGENEPRIYDNLLADNPANLNMLDSHPLAKDLISWMLSHDPKDRPSAEEALQHPYLKSKEQQFNLLCGIGNEPHVKKKDVNSDVVKELNNDTIDWRTRMESDVLKYLSYDQLKKISFKYTSSWTDCLRLIRNIKEHWKDCPRTEPEAMKVGDPQEYFLTLFPDLVLRVYKIARSCDDLKELPGLKEYFREDGRNRKNIDPAAGNHYELENEDPGPAENAYDSVGPVGTSSVKSKPPEKNTLPPVYAAVDKNNRQGNTLYASLDTDAMQPKRESKKEPGRTPQTEYACIDFERWPADDVSKADLV